MRVPLHSLFTSLDCVLCHPLLLCTPHWLAVSLHFSSCTLACNVLSTLTRDPYPACVTGAPPGGSPCLCLLHWDLELSLEPHLYTALFSPVMVQLALFSASSWRVGTLLGSQH
jgi:hypothetical protein